MPISAKDALSEAGISDSAKSEAPGSQPSSATGTEVPVTVHASRYSSASKGTGKLPPVHEDTRTVIIFPQGAVVRLSANVTAGELVVLTNNRTGTDVICRVTSVKTQPGIQNYVHLEFTQRAMDFWEETSSAGSGASIRKTLAVTTPPPLPLAHSPVNVASKAANPTEPQAARRTSVSAAEVEVKGSSEPKITTLADLPAVGAPDSFVKAGAKRAEASEIAPAATPVQSGLPVGVPASPRFQPFEIAVPQRSTKSRSITLFLIAAAVVVAIGSVAGPELWKRYGDLIPGFQNVPVATESTPMAAPSEQKAPIVKTAGDAKPAEPITVKPVEKAPTDTPAIQPGPVQRVVEGPATELQPQPVVRPALNVGKISKPKVKKPAQVNSSEPPPVLLADTSASPNIIGQSLSSAMPQSGAVPTPAAPAPPKGGDLQQPKLLSSVAAVYPPLARAQGVQGDVTIDALIDANGKVSATNVLTGSPLLQRAAIDALRQWKYQPAKLNGEPIPIHINVTIAFHLK